MSKCKCGSTIRTAASRCHRCAQRSRIDAARVQQMKWYRDEGYSFRAVGKMFGLSGQRVHAILKALEV